MSSQQYSTNLLCIETHISELLSIITFHYVARTSAFPAQDAPPQIPLSSPHGAVASESKICSEIGIGLLKRGVCLTLARLHNTLLIKITPHLRATPQTPM